VAVDGSHIYWANLGSNTIGQATLQGTAVTQRFITGAREPTGVAVDATHLYWANSRAIAQARLNGTHIVQHFVRTHEPYGVAVSPAGAVPGKR
jgi:DNA-binding beta-propeller fold protein YncE